MFNLYKQFDIKSYYYHIVNIGILQVQNNISKINDTNHNIRNYRHIYEHNKREHIVNDLYNYLNNKTNIDVKMAQNKSYNL